ncbi:hypothetical protein BDFG_04497 [Blastomyces dermatitidis ATCC 26199]|nr:hypothetical protein BDFG_04497 [Blastomyces dermatitidis ATCC 26199]
MQPSHTSGHHQHVVSLLECLPLKASTLKLRMERPMDQYEIREIILPLTRAGFEMGQETEIERTRAETALHGSIGEENFALGQRPRLTSRIRDGALPAILSRGKKMTIDFTSVFSYRVQ